MAMPKVLQIIMPMAGSGSRFAEQGYAVPKPLIAVNDGTPMFAKALSSFDGCQIPKKVFCVIQQAHVDAFARYHSLYHAHCHESLNMVTLAGPTRGAVETSLAVRPMLQLNAPVIVLDCDLWFASEQFMAFVRANTMTSHDACGGLVHFTSTDARYSYAQCEAGSGRVIRTAEKQPISQHALIGSYFFSQASLFLRAADRLIATGLNHARREFYTSLLFNQLIQDGVPVYAFASTAYRSYGTPEELMAAR